MAWTGGRVVSRSASRHASSRGVRHASGVARSSRDEVEMRARVEDAGGDGRDLERGRPAGGVSRRLGRLALEETLHGDAGHALVHGL